MRNIIIFIFLFIITLLLAIIVVFFRDQFLFFLHGFDVSLIKDSKPESYEAYPKIYKSKVIIIFVGFALSIVTLLFSNRILSQNSYLGFRFLHWICWIFVIVFAINCFFLLIFPKRLM